MADIGRSGWRKLGSSMPWPGCLPATAVTQASAADSQDRARIRVAAEACANPRMRIALEQVARDELEDEAIEEALAAEEAARATR
jgi:hypothetical protein